MKKNKGYIGVLVANMMGFDTVVEESKLVRRTEFEAHLDAKFLRGLLTEEEASGVWVDVIKS